MIFRSRRRGRRGRKRDKRTLVDQVGLGAFCTAHLRRAKKSVCVGALSTLMEQRMGREGARKGEKGPF